jgi:CDP-4-dehydro-6-deoxyglucose reductase
MFLLGEVELSYQVELKMSGKTFLVEGDETVLEAALRQGINLPYGCKNGACGSCKGKLLSGKLSHGDHSRAP